MENNSFSKAVLILCQSSLLNEDKVARSYPGCYSACLLSIDQYQFAESGGGSVAVSQRFEFEFFHG
jgi:hypothetical protein